MLKNNCIILFFLLICLSACNTTKHVAENEYLLQENTILVNDKTNLDDTIDGFLAQRPNRKLAGVPLSLHLHNTRGVEFTKLYNQWKRQQDTGDSLNLSPKMLKKLNRGYNNWFYKNFEAPSILDTLKSKQTAINLQNYYFNQGYFRAKVNYEHLYKKDKRAYVTYKIKTGEPTFLDSLSHKITSPALDSLYVAHKNKSLLKKGEQFNLGKIEAEVDRLSKLYRNNGVYHFTKSVIDFHDIDTLSHNYLTNIETQISDRIIENGDNLTSKPFTIQKIKNIKIFTDYNYEKRNDAYLDTIQYKGYTFISHTTNKYNPKLLANSLLIEPNSIYRDSDRELTRRSFRSLKNFRLVNIKYNEP